MASTAVASASEIPSTLWLAQQKPVQVRFQCSLIYHVYIKFNDLHVCHTFTTI